LKGFEEVSFTSIVAASVELVVSVGFSVALEVSVGFSVEASFKSFFESSIVAGVLILVVSSSVGELISTVFSFLLLELTELLLTELLLPEEVTNESGLKGLLKLNPLLKLEALLLTFDLAGLARAFEAFLVELGERPLGVSLPLPLVILLFELLEVGLFEFVGLKLFGRDNLDVLVLPLVELGLGAILRPFRGSLTSVESALGRLLGKNLRPAIASLVLLLPLLRA